MNAEQISELYRLLNALREDIITDADFERLDSWITENDRVCRLYVDYIKIWAELQGFQAAAMPDDSSVSEDTWLSNEKNFAESQFWGILAAHEKAAEAVELAKQKPQQELIQQVVYASREKPKISKSLIFTFVSVAAALLILIMYVNLFPVSRSIATLAESAHAQWADTECLIEIGTRLKQDEMRFLKQGVVKILFDSGAEVVLEGPSVIKLQDSDSMAIYSGRLYASVPRQATGFVVNTPSARIVDLGTEFGVDVDVADTVRAEVYKGQVAMQVGPDSAASNECVIGVGQAGLVGRSGQLSIAEFSLQRRGFIQRTEEFRLGVSLLNRNLVVNGDFEKDNVVYDIQKTDSQKLTENNINISGWQDSSPATLNTYATMGGGEISSLQRSAIPVPPDKGNCFFVGHEDSVITQEINVAELLYKINRREIGYELSGWIGGWLNHEDALEITALFYDYSNELIGSAAIGPVTAEQRNNQTGFVERSDKGIIPPGTLRIIVRLTATKRDGDSADAYADNLKFVLNSLN
ncbi:MAG TPA: FecR family protein [Anaerohalosphaeraceae bacterium]|nr:FecR family protein [Anaerohalosphaeraceae bacterium]